MGSEVPEQVEEFLHQLQVAIKDKDIYAVDNLVSKRFAYLTELYYHSSSWPTPEEVSPIVEDDVLFLTLYRDLFYRHLFTFEDRSLNDFFESWQNYYAENPVELFLPNQWVWEMINEYVHQFEQFCVFRSEVDQRTEEELRGLGDNTDVWSPLIVIRALVQMIEKSEIRMTLEDPDVKTEFSTHPLYKMLGYYSIISLCRIHTTLGDYYNALKVLEGFDFNSKKAMSTRIMSCHICLSYHVAFSYLMMRRYEDAMKTASNVLLYLVRGHHNEAEFAATIDRLFSIIALCVGLSTLTVDDSIINALKDKFQDKVARIQHMDMSSFDEMFESAVPVFISPAVPSYSKEESAAPNPFQSQKAKFVNEIMQQEAIPALSSVLRLYTSISIEKLQSYLGAEDLERLLLSFRHKTLTKVNGGEGSPLDGEFKAASEVNFRVDGNMITINESRVQRSYAEYFLKHMTRMEDLL